MQLPIARWVGRTESFEMIEATQNDDRCIEGSEMGQFAYYTFSISILCH